MSDMAESRGGSTFLQAQQPRVLFLVLAAWDIVGGLVELLAKSNFSLNVTGGFDGVLAGRVLSLQTVPLAVLYLYCSRDPRRYNRVFWLALIEQSVAVGANLYHFAADHLEFEAIFVNVVVSASLGALVFLHLFQPRESDQDGP